MSKRNGFRQVDCLGGGKCVDGNSEYLGSEIRDH